MSVPPKPPKPGVAQSVYLQVPKEETSPFFSNLQTFTQHNLAAGTGNPFDDMDDNELNRIVRSTNPFEVEFSTTNIATSSSNTKQSKRPVLNSFDDINIVSKNKKNLNESKRGGRPKSEKSDSEKQQNESDKSRTRESRSKFMKKIHKMETKVTKNSYDQHTVMAVDNEDENAVIRFLLSERVYGYPTTNGTIMSNYKHYVFNNHPLLSIVLMNSRHPFERKRRVIVFLITLAFAIFVSFLLLKTDVVVEIARCRSGCHKQSVNLNSNSTSSGSGANSGNSGNSTICSGGYNNGMEFDKYDSQCHFYQDWMLSAVCGAITVLYGGVLRFLATCDCLHGRAFFQNNCCGTRIKNTVVYLGGIVLSLFTLFSLFLLLWTVVQCYLTKIGYTIFTTILTSKLWSFVEWFVWAGPFFSYRYPVDKRHFYNRLNNKNASGKLGPSSNNVSDVEMGGNPSAVSGDRNVKSGNKSTRK